MSRIARATSFRTADTSGPVLETTVGGLLGQAAVRAAGAVALVEGTLDPVCRDGRVFHHPDRQAIPARVGGEVVAYGRAICEASISIGGNGSVLANAR
jgi:hypothetical protein